MATGTDDKKEPKEEENLKTLFAQARPKDLQRLLTDCCYN